MITIITGGQYGSEGKGEIVAEWCREKHPDVCARTGGPNSGHTVHHEGAVLVTQQLPAGWVNPNTKLVIGAGALVDVDRLIQEVEEAGKITKEGKTIWSRIRIDQRAWPILLRDKDASRAEGRHLLFGSTGKGCGPAMVARINRRESRLIREVINGRVPHGVVGDTEMILNDMIRKGADLVIEGTQGALLDMYLSTRPYSTHRSTGPATWLAELGISPTAAPMQVVMVLRTFPIRVAGNSGPMNHEITWLNLAEEIRERKMAYSRKAPLSIQNIEALHNEVDERAAALNLNADFLFEPRHRWNTIEAARFSATLLTVWGDCIEALPDEHRVAWSKFVERTTVTQNVRRIGHLNYSETYQAARRLAPTILAVTFMDYLHEKGVTRRENIHLYDDLLRWSGAEVAMASWGPGDIEWLS